MVNKTILLKKKILVVLRKRFQFEETTSIARIVSMTLRNTYSKLIQLIKTPS
jgi:hypothetical protein